MNREIKFRAWDKTGNTMHDDGEAKYWLSQGFDETFPDEYNFMQYIGLKDKNGTEIYRDDIVKDEHGRIMKVGYWNFRPCWIAVTKTNFHHADFFEWCQTDSSLETDDNPLGFTGTARVEIIGNIYQHPHLLTT